MDDKKLIKPLHGLRGVAALTVVLGHYLDGGAAALGVVLFFVLSGFLIGKLYIEKDFTTTNVLRYAVARFARVYPLFAVVIIGTGLLNLVTQAGIFGLDVEDIWKHLLLAGNGGTVWTIATEFQFYAFFVLVWALRAFLPSAFVTVLPLLLLASAIAFWIGTDATRIGLFGYLHIFLLGALTAVVTANADQAWENIAARAVPLFVLAYLAVFVFLPAFHPPRWVYLEPVSIVICAALLASTILGGNCIGNRILSLPVFMWLGEISFGVYLLHRHAQWFVDGVMGQDAGDWVTLFPKIALTLVLAHLANKTIERPCRAWLRRVGDRMTQRIKT